MANAIYPKYKEALISGGSNVNLATGTVKVALVDTGAYTYNSTHQYFSSVSSAVVGTPATLANKTTTNGVFDADDVTFTGLPNTSIEALVIYVDTGNAATSPLVAYQDTGVTGLPFTTNNGNASIQWDAAGIFAL